MSRTIRLSGLSVAIVALAMVRPCAAIQAPVAYWTFNNDESQTFGTFDGKVPDQGSANYDLWVDHYTSATSAINPPGQIFFQSNEVWNPDGTLPAANDGANPAYDGTPVEHYVTSGALPAGSSKAYHLEGGINYQYYDTYPGGGDGDIDPQLDASAEYPYIFQEYSWRDRLEVESTEEGVVSPDIAGAFDSTGTGNGSITYAFWLRVNAAGLVDTDRFPTGFSYLIGRGTDAPSYGGQVVFKLQRGGGTAFNPAYYGLQVRNDCNGESGCTGGFGETGTTAGDMDVKQFDWHHWVVQYDLTDVNEGKVQVWLDGGLLNTAGQNGQTGLFAGQQTEFTGMGASPITGRFRLNNTAHPGVSVKQSGDFYLDDLAVFNGALLTDQDVYDIFLNGIENITFDPMFDPADTDKDGDVDTADLTTMFQNFTGDGGTGKTMMQGDTDMDGDVDTADLTLGFQHFTGALSGLAAVPEPSTWVLLLLGGAGLALFARKRPGR